MPLQPIFEVRPFSKWGLDFIEPINPSSSTGHMFVLTSIDYCMQWTKVETFRNCTIKVVTDFLEEHIVTRFEIPFFVVCDNGSYFASFFLTQWEFKNQFIIKFSSNYYPQGNGMSESTNKNLITIIKHLLTENRKDWHTQLKYALWTDRVRIKNTLEIPPYLLFYGQDLVFPLNLKI